MFGVAQVLLAHSRAGNLLKAEGGSRMDGVNIAAVACGPVAATCGILKDQLSVDQRSQTTNSRSFWAAATDPREARVGVALQSPVEVIPTGEAGSCHLFPEITMGNLHESEVAEIWRGPAYQDISATVSRCGLVPALAKCNLLYVRGL